MEAALLARCALPRSGVLGLLGLLGLLPTTATAPGAAARGGGGADSVVYVVSPASRFEVKTGKAGLLGFAGHDHLVRARAFWGRIVHYRDSSAASHVTIAVATDSLDVISSSDTAERRQVTEAMHRDVLHSDRYHEITFASHAVAPSESGFRVQGDLTLAGVTRELVVDLAVVISGDTLRATTRFTIKQSDFGIKPYRGGPGGLVRVADRVTFDIEAIGVAQPAL
jgi:polyisoprenoid-binding protein YceI